jgi:hypothetical protein
MPEVCFVLFYCVPIAWVLYSLTRRFVVNDTLSRVILFCLILALTSLALPCGCGLVSMAQLRHERQHQRELLASRVAQAGGWEALRRDGLALMEKHKDDSFFQWHKWSTNTLPASLAALKPWYVDYESHQSPKVELVRIKVFGMHSTGGHSTPYLGVEVVTGPGSGDYLPKPVEAASGNAHTRFSKMAEGIYEIY